MKTKAQELAAILDGREYRKEITKEEALHAREDGLVIVFGASDDLMEFEGAIRDEVGCCNGGIAFLTNEGLLQNDCDDDRCPHYKRAQAKCATIEAKWDTDGYSWIYETSIPHVTFDIVEDGESYCRGIVFSLSDVAPHSVKEADIG